MSKIFIIHGAFGNPNENWFPWLKKELENLGHEVLTPKFPTPKNQSLENWNKVFDEYKLMLDDETIFVGHSLAPAFILSILEQINIKIKACFFVSGFINLLGNETFDSINKTFLDKTFNWIKIKENCGDFFLYHSDNDPYVSINYANELAEKISTNINIILGAGHFNESSGYNKFQRLLDDIKLIL